MRPESSTGAVRWLRPTTIRDTTAATLGFFARPRISVENAGIQSLSPIGPFEGTARRSHFFPGLRQQLQQPGPFRAHLFAYMVAQVGGQRGAPAAGADGDDEIALAHHRHERERAVGRVVGRVHPDAARFTGLEHRTVDGRVAGGGGGEPGAVEVGGFRRRAGRGSPLPASAQASTSSPTSSAITSTAAPAVEQRFDLARRDPPGTDDDTAPALTTRFTG